MKRAALFAFVGVAFFSYWVWADPSYEEEASQSEWDHVLAFSGVILLIAIAVPLFAQFAGGRHAFWVSLVVAAGAGLSSFANILEDGLQMDWVFFAFVLGSAIVLLGLLALTLVIALASHGYRRLVAVVPAGTMLALIMFVAAGGPLMLVTWLTAAVFALTLQTRRSSRLAATAPRRPVRARRTS